MKFRVLSIFPLLLGGLQISAQSITDAQRLQQSKIEVQSTKQINQAASQALRQGKEPTGQASTNINASDTGMQRPVFLNTSNLSYFASITNSINRSANPLQEDTDLGKDKFGGHSFSWSKSLNLGALTNPIDINSVMLTIIAGGGWTDVEHLHAGSRELDGIAIPDGYFKTMNSQSTSAYLLFMMQHESGWNYSVGSNLVWVNDSATKDETYRSFSPNVSAAKPIQFPFDIVGVFKLDGGVNFSDTNPNSTAGTTQDRDEQDNWNIAASLGFNYELWDIILSPKYTYSRLAYLTDSPGVNQYRVDYTNTLSLDANYNLSDNMSLGLNYSFEQRDSNKPTFLVKKYKNWNAGANVGISVNF
jgi:hypothetical protein